MTTLMVTPCPFLFPVSATVASILEGVGTPGQELQRRRGGRPWSKDVIPVHEQDQEGSEPGRTDPDDQMVRDPSPLGLVGQRPVDREQHGQEPRNRQERPPREDE